ncbi:MAG: tetratricopeptide repeat protein [bacterium]
MQNLGLNGDVQAGGHRFHVQTTYSAGNEKIISHVFEQGQVIDRHELFCPGESNPQILSSKLHALHLETMADLNLLFHIAEKVRRSKHPPSYLRLGAVFLEKNLTGEALAVLQQAIELAPEMPEAYRGLGHAFLRQADLGRAEEMFRRGLELAPEFADLHHDLGLALLEQDRLLEALPCFEAALHVNPGFAQAHLLLALALLLTLQGPQPLQDHLPPPSIRLKRAQDHLNTLVQAMAPQKLAARKGVMAKITSAETALARKDHAEAIAVLQTVREGLLAEPERVFENEFYLKFMFGGKSRDDAFIQRYMEILRAATQDFPEYADLHNHLGLAYVIQSRNLFQHAIEEFRLALKINPEYQHAERNLKLSENDSKSFVYLLRAMLR